MCGSNSKVILMFIAPYFRVESYLGKSNTAIIVIEIDKNILLEKIEFDLFIVILTNNMQSCIICGIEKPFTDFWKSKKHKSGYMARCIECEKIKNRTRYLRDAERVKAAAREYRAKNPEKISAFNKKYREEHPEKLKEYHTEWREKNADHVLEYNRNYHKEHNDEILAYRREYYHKVTKQDPNAHLRNNLRGRVRRAMEGNNKSAKTMELTGCTVDFLRDWLEFQFDDNMTWDNYGSYWHIDHILPCASFDLTDPEQQRKCFHYSNLQPLTASDNLSKGARLDWEKIID